MMKLFIFCQFLFLIHWSDAKGEEVTPNKKSCPKIPTNLRHGEELHDPTGSTSWSGRSEIFPAIRPSLFPHVPPYIYFISYGQQNQELPPQIRRKLKWRIANTKSRVIARTVTTSGLNLIKKSTGWTYLWDKFVKPKKFYLRLKQHQKVNQLPGSGQLCCKDLLWKNLNRSIQLHGHAPFDFVPQTFILPKDIDLLKLRWDTKNTEMGHKDPPMWFLKPPRKANGNGIRVISNWQQVPTDSKMAIVQEYIKPFLVNDRKFDLRLYVLVTSFYPLRVYLYRDGFVRFASMKYSNDSRNAHEVFMHLTNRGVNKKSSLYIKNNDINGYHGNQWSVQALWRFLEKEGHDTNLIREGIKDVVVKTLISAQKGVMRSSHLLPNRQSSYQLYGFDIGLDESLKPWLFEINSSPGMGTDSGFLLALKRELVREYFNIVGYHYPPSLSKKSKRTLLKRLRSELEVETPTFDKRLYTIVLTEEETKKHLIFTTIKSGQDNYLTEILKNLTGDDLRQLITAEDEFSQCREFERIFPTTKSDIYLKYGEEPQYYNLLLHSWEIAHAQNRTNGIEQLKNLANKKLHLNPQ